MGADHNNAIHRTKIIEAPYWESPASNSVITEILEGGEVTLNLGRRIYDDPHNPYGVDLIVYGYSFFSASGFTGQEVNDTTDLNVAKIEHRIFSPMRSLFP